MTFAAYSSKTITSNGYSLPNITFDGVGGTWALQDNLTATAAETTTLTNGTLNINDKTLTTGLFDSNNSNVRALTFGVGSIVVTGNSATVVNIPNLSNITYTGTGKFNLTYSGSTGTRTIDNGSASGTAGKFNYYITAGTDTISFLGGVDLEGLDFTGFSGTLAAIAVGGLGVAGNVIFSTGMSLTSSTTTLVVNFVGNPSSSITTNGKTLDFNIGVYNGTLLLNDALTMGSAKTLTHSGGTLNLNGKTLTVGTAYTTATSTVKNLTFNGGTLVCPNSGATAFNNASPANYTTTAGTGTGYISMTSASAKTFVGGGSTFNCTLQQTGAGALTITGANTFNDIANTVQPATVTFPASTTNTFTSGFSLSGTSGNLLTINSSSAGTAATISKASGTVSVSYCSIKDSAATGGATWNAFTTNGNVNVSGNSGWNFGTAATTNFLMFFSY
jgi:hypothetical protein